jgi:hypothetical protein
MQINLDIYKYTRMCVFACIMAFKAKEADNKIAF